MYALQHSHLAVIVESFGLKFLLQSVQKYCTVYAAIKKARLIKTGPFQASNKYYITYLLQIYPWQ